MQLKVDLGYLEALGKTQDYCSFSAFPLWISKCFVNIHQASPLPCEVLKHRYFPKGG